MRQYEGPGRGERGVGVSRRWSASAALIGVVAAGVGVLAPKASATTAHTVDTTCTESVYGTPFSYARSLTVAAGASDTVPADGTLTISGPAEHLALPDTSDYPEIVTGYQNIETDYKVAGGTITAITQTAPAALDGSPLPSAVLAGGDPSIVRAVVSGPIPPGTLTTPAFTMTVTPDDGSSAIPE